MTIMIDEAMSVDHPIIGTEAGFDGELGIDIGLPFCPGDAGSIGLQGNESGPELDRVGASWR